MAIKKKTRRVVRGWVVVDTACPFPLSGLIIDPRHTRGEEMMTSAVFEIEEDARKIKKLSDAWCKQRKIKKHTEVVPCTVIFII